MAKKIMTFALGMIVATVMMAQSTDTTNTPTPTEATIDSSEILYWVGTGENSAILAVNWLDTALAWGYRWSDSTTTVQSMLYGIAAADPRFSVYIFSMTLNGITYNDGTVNLTLSSNSFWRDRVNGGYNSQGLSRPLANGDFVKYADYNAHVSTGYNEIYATPIHPVSDPNSATDTTSGDDTTMVAEATIDSSEILYWVGTGENSAILAVNWLDTALAWGYRWSDSATVQSMLYGIAAADPRFSVYIYYSNISSITYREGNVSLSLSSNSFWRCLINGIINSNPSQMLTSGDFVKCADYNTGVTTDSTFNDNGYGGGYWSYRVVYPMTIYPASAPGSTVDSTYNTITTTQTACNQYTWSVNGVTYTNSGTYQYIDSSSNSRYVLNLTINRSMNIVDSVATGSSYYWHGNYYNASGTYTYNFIDSNGCTGTETLILTITGSNDSTGNVYHVAVRSNNLALGMVLGSGDYTAGAQAFLYAVPIAGKVFNMWIDTNNATVSTDNPFAVTVNGNKSFTASFSDVATHDTVYIRTHDTIYIHDTIYGGDGIDEIATVNVRLYQRDGRIVVENGDAMPLPAVILYDAVGRKLESVAAGCKVQHTFDVPTAGVYIIKVGELPARSVVVVK